MEVESQKTVRLGPREGRTVHMPGAQLVTRKVSAHQTGGAYSVFEVEVRPGGGEEPHIQHRDDECLYVLEGLFEFLDDEGSIAEAGLGSLVYVAKGSLHRYRNVGETTGRLLIVHTPGASRERFVEEAGEPDVEGAASPVTEEPPDSEGLAAMGVEYGIEIVPLPPSREGTGGCETSKKKRKAAQTKGDYANV